MGKIDELIKQFCPDGVKKVPLGDVLDYEQPSKYIVKSTEYDNSYNIPVLTAGKGFLLGYTNEQTGVYAASEENPTIIFDDFVTSFHWVDFPFKVKSSAMKMLTCKDKVNSFRFIYYAMCEIGFVAKEHSRHWISVYSKIEIPLPPLAVQKEIVEILDTFTGMTDNLQKELEQRQKQFEYYQEKILNFDDVIQQEGEVFIKKKGILGEIDELIKQLCPDGIRETLLGEIMTIVRGASPRPIKNYMSDKINGIPWIKIGDVNPNDKYIRNTAEYVTKEGAKKSRFLHKGDFILSNSMSFGRPYILGIDGCIHDGWIAMSGFEKDVCSKYLYYILRCDTTQKYWRMHANNGGAMTNLNADIVRGTPIPLPPLAVQAKIVEFLDTFTGMIDNLQQEIELRQKQYEYYREKLLTFE